MIESRIVMYFVSEAESLFVNINCLLFVLNGIMLTLLVRDTYVPRSRSLHGCEVQQRVKHGTHSKCPFIFHSTLREEKI